jgi:hypothetical protein
MQLCNTFEASGVERGTNVRTLDYATAMTSLKTLAVANNLSKELGETAIEGQGMLDAPSWRWPDR